MSVMPAYQVWVELVLVLSTAAAAMVAAAAACDRLAHSAVWKRTIWQIAAAGILALFAVEATGTGRGVVQLCRAALAPSVGETAESPVATPANDKMARLTVSSPLPPFDAESRRPNEPEVSKGGFAGRLDSRDGRPVGDYGPVTADSLESAPAMDSYDKAFLSELEHASSARGERLHSSRPSTASEGHRTEIETTFETSPGIAGAMLEPPPVAGWPALVWGFGAMLVAVPVVWSRLLLVFFGGRGAAAADPALERRVARLARRLEIRRRVRVLELPGLAAPVAFGMFRPTIGLPAGFGKRADGEGGEAMLAHELAHLAAGDPIWQLLGDLLAAVLWWQVPVWWLRRRLAATAELAADEASLLVPDGPDRLAAALVELGRRMARPRLAGWIAITGAGFRSSLGRRVERLLRLENSLPQTPGRRALFCAKTMVPWILIVVMVLGTAWARPRAAFAEGGSMMNVLKTSWRASLAGMALVAVLAPAAVDATDEATAERAAPAVAAADVSGDGHLLAQREDGDRREDADRRENADRDRERGDRDRPDADRERGERDREHADRDRKRGDRDRPAVERERGERDREHAERERGQRDRPAVEEIDQHLHELERRHGELGERAEAIERQLRELGDRPGERGEALRAELEKIHGAAREIEENFHRLQREREERVRGVEERERRDAERREGDELEAHARELTQHRRELQERAEQLRRKREELGDSRPDAAEEIERAFDRTRAEIEEVNQNLRRIEIEAKRRQLDRRFEELVGAVRRAEEAGRRDEAEQLERQAREVREAWERLDREEAGPDRPHPEQLERAVDELREQVQDLRRAVAELHEAVGRIVDRLEDLSEDHENGDDREENGDRDDDR